MKRRNRRQVEAEALRFSELGKKHRIWEDAYTHKNPHRRRATAIDDMAQHLADVAKIVRAALTDAAVHHRELADNVRYNDKDSTERLPVLDFAPTVVLLSELTELFRRLHLEELDLLRAESGETWDRFATILGSTKQSLHKSWTRHKLTHMTSGELLEGLPRVRFSIDEPREHDRVKWDWKVDGWPIYPEADTKE